MGTHRASIRREIRSIERGLQQFQREVGDFVDWYEFDGPNSSGGDTYQEGGIPDLAPSASGVTPTGVGLVFKAPVAIPAVWIRFESPGQIQTSEGEYTVNRTTLRFSVKVMTTSGLQNPLNPAAHYNDRYSYNGFLYRVESYTLKGWLHNAYLMVDVGGRQLKEEELESDPFPIGENVATSTPWTPGQHLDWAPSQPADWENS